MDKYKQPSHNRRLWPHQKKKAKSRLVHKHYPAFTYVAEWVEKPRRGQRQQCQLISFWLFRSSWSHFSKRGRCASTTDMKKNLGALVCFIRPTVNIYMLPLAQSFDLSSDFLACFCFLFSCSCHPTQKWQLHFCPAVVLGSLLDRNKLPIYSVAFFVPDR